MPHVAFLHERFLFRFGHDRTMLLHGRELVRRGWTVSFVAFDADAEVIASIGARLVRLPQGAPSYAELDAFGCAYLRDRWFDLFRDGAPDVVVNGGWPFYAFNSEAEALGAAAVVFDAGATPVAPDAPDRQVQERLRSLRRRHMGESRRAVAVSEFIASSQTRLDAPGVDLAVVLNGVDHIVEPLWTKSPQGPNDEGVDRALAAGRGRRTLLHLGRWEGGYKNRNGALEVLRRVRAKHDAVLLVLADGDPDLPSDLSPHVLFAGRPGDAGLRRLMSACEAGLSASTWEGFNLPLAEMLFLGRPAFALDVGAHREVVASPQSVQPDLDALADAVSRALDAPASEPTAEALASYRARFAWVRAAGELEAVLWQALQEKRAEGSVQALVMDVTNASRDPANTGVVRVTRQLGHALQPLHRLVFVAWDEVAAGYRTLDAGERARLASYGGPVPGEDAREGGGPAALPAALAALRMTLAHCAWLCPETVLQARGPAVTDWFARERLDYVAVLHDLMPETHPQFCAPEIVDAWAPYARFLERARLLLANSETTAEAWALRQEGRRQGPAVAVERLPGDFGPRAAPRRGGRSDPVRILTVSTFEPRKNHSVLLAAFALARTRALAAGRELELHLVGGGYGNDGGVLARVRALAADTPGVVLHGLVDDPELERLYALADFTVYPSLWEGFGLPLAESVHRARPFVTSDRGSMAEIAASSGAGLTCDVADPEALAQAMLTLALDDGLRTKLGRIAALTPVRTWDDYARACLAHAVAGRPKPSDQGRPAIARRRAAPETSPLDWNALLYPGKPVHTWQMSDSERMALTGLLARRRPRTYLEIGTYHGGSALLASEFADWVITVDIDAEAEARFDKPANVTFVAGRSQDVLPDLLSDLLARDLYPEFVLIDGDHSAEGVRRDIELFLREKPPHPLVIVFHDSFNPECRAGIRTAPWGDCPYVSRLEIDFVPGRVIEAAGDKFEGEMWGGLAVAVLTPEPHRDPLLLATSEPLFQRTLASVSHRAA